MSNIYYWEKLTFSNLDGKVNFSERKFWRNSLALKSKKVQGIFEKMFILGLFPSAVSRPQNVSQISFDLFCSGDKRLLLEFLGKWGWIQDIMNVSPKHLS